MRIQSVSLTGFGPFAEETMVEFPEAGLSVVLGPNESGKSILMNSIAAILFGLTPDQLESLRNGPSTEGRVRLLKDETQLEIVRDFSGRRIELWDVSGDERVSIYSGDDEVAYGTVLSRAVGLQDDSTPTGTTFIRHGEMATRVSPVLNAALCHSKQTSFEKILTELKEKFARISCIDPVTGEQGAEEGELQRIEGALSRMVDGRQKAQAALNMSMQLEEEGHALQQQLTELRADIEVETRTLEALGLLEGLQAEERGLEDQVKGVETNELTVRQLQSDLAATIERVNSEHAPLLPLQGTFLDEVRALEDSRAELARVQKEVETVNGHRRDLQNQVRNLTEEHTSLYGAFDGLPLDFPERLALYPVRVKELEEVTVELKAVDERIALLQAEIDEHFARFKRFDDDYGDDLADLGVQETYWHQQLRDLEADQKRCQETSNDVAEVENSLNTEFAAFSGVAKDFRSRLRNWHRIWQELQARKGPVTKAQDEIADIQAAIDRYKAGAQNGAAAFVEAVADRERVDGEVARLEKDRDALVNWSEECQSIARRFNTEFAHLNNKVRPDFPDKLREYALLKEEYRVKGSDLEEARQRLKESEEQVAERFTRFADKGLDWGVRLEEHRQTVEHSQAILDRLKREEEQVADLTRERAIMDGLVAEGAEVYGSLPDSFPDMVREYSRLKTRTQSYATESAEYAQAYAEFASAPEDFAEHIAQYRADRASVLTVAPRIAESQEALGRHERKLQAMDIVLDEDYPHFKDTSADTDKVLASFIRVQSQRKEAQKEWQAAVARHQDLVDEKGKDKGFGALLGWNTERKKEITTLEARIDTLVAQMAELDKEAPSLRTQLGSLADREDLEALATDYATYKKLQEERSSLLAQSETAGTTLKAYQAESQQLEERIERHCGELGVENDDQAEALARRYQEYLDSLERRAASKDDDTRRVSELATELGPLAERFSGESSTYGDVQTALVEGFKTHKQRQTDAEALKARIEGMSDAAETNSIRNRTLAAMSVEASELGLQPGESVEELVGEWQEYEPVLVRMQADKVIIKEAQQDDGGEKSRLKVLSTRLDELQGELETLAAHPNIEELIEQINLYFHLQARLGQLAGERPDLPPREDVEAELATFTRERRALESLGVKAGSKADDAEEGFKKWKKICERLESRQTIVRKQLELEEKDGKTTTVLERIQRRLDEQASGLGNYTEVTDLDDTLRRYDEYLALTVRLEGLKKTIEILPPQEELESTYTQVKTEMAEARDKLGLADGEVVSDISVLHEQYSELVRRLRTEDESRNRTLTALSCGDRAGRPSPEVLGELSQKLEELRLSLGGFEDAGDESEEVVGQFHASEELKGEIEALQTTIDALRTIRELDEWIESTRQPVLALERRLEVAGDVNNLRALRGRFRAFEQLQETIRGLRESLEKNPTLDELAATKQGYRDGIADVEKRVRSLFDEHPRLESWYKKYLEQPAELRPGVSNHLTGQHNDAADLEQMIETTWANLKQHNETTSEILVNLPLRDQNIRQMQKQLHAVAMQKESLKRAVDGLVRLLGMIPELLAGSLQLRATEALKGLTEGRYTEMRLEGPHLEPVVKSPEGIVQRGETVTGGLRDQLYFALRVAMAQELGGTIGLPFLIDDPFMHLDHNRLQQAQSYLKTLGDRCQVVIFTHDERFRDCGPIAHDLNQLALSRHVGNGGTPAVAPVPAG